MLSKQQYPILEFDPDTSAKIEPSKLTAKKRRLTQGLCHHLLRGGD